MALSDVIDRLTEVNEEQLVETKDIRIEMESLTDRVTDLVELNKQDRLERLESLREGAGAFEAPSLTGGDAGVRSSGGGDGGKGMLGGLASAFMGFFGLKAFLGGIAAFGGKLLSLFKGVGRFLGPIGLIITAIIGTFAAIEGFIKGYEEGGIIGGLEGAVKGFFGAIISAPLDLIRQAAAWIAIQLGFSKAGAFLKSFSFAEIFNTMIGGIFDGVRGVVDTVTAIFTFDKDGGILGNFGTLVDIIYAPLGLAISFVRGMFGWGKEDEDAEPFRISTFLSSVIKNAMNWIMTDVFGFEAEDTDQNLMGFLGDLFTTIFDQLMQTAINFGKSIKRDIDMTVDAFGFTFMNMFDQLLLAIQKRVRIKLPELPGNDLKIGLGPASFTVPKGAILAGQEFGVGDPDATQQRIDTRKLQMMDTVNAYEAAGGGLYSGYFEPVMNNSGAAIQTLNGAAGASTAGTNVYVSGGAAGGGGGGGGGGGVAAAPNVASSTAAEVPNHYMGMHPDLVYGGSMPTSR